MAEGDFTSFPKLPLHLILQAPIFYIRKKKKNLDGFVFGSKNMYQMKWHMIKMVYYHFD